MTLQTWQEEKIFHGVERLERQVERLTALVEEILKDVKPKPVTYRPTSRISVTPL
jgi:hypothetical protein